MKKFKTGVILIAVVCAFSLNGCGKIEEKVSQKASEKLAEGMIEKATGSEVDIKTGKDGAVKIDTEEGSFEGGENLKWPKENMGDLPEPKAVITVVMKDDANKGGTVAFKDMSKDEAAKYTEKIKSLGYGNGMNINDADSIMVTGQNEKGASVNFIYNITAKEGTIAYTGEGANTGNNNQPASAQVEEENKSYFEQAENIDMQEEYPKDRFPVLDGDKITDSNMSDNDDRTEYYLTVISDKPIKDIVEKYESLWKLSGLEGISKSRSNDDFYIEGENNGYYFYLSGYVEGDEQKSVTYNITISQAKQ